MTPADPVGKLLIVLFGLFDALLRFSSTGYSPDVADLSAIGLGNPSDTSRNSAPSWLHAFCDHELWQLCVGRPRACRFL